MTPNWAIDQGLLTPYEYAAIAVIGRYMPNSFPGVSKIAEKGNMSRAQAFIAIKGLCDKGLIKKTKRVGTSNHYEYTPLFYNGGVVQEVDVVVQEVDYPSTLDRRGVVQEVDPIQININQRNLTKYTHPEKTENRVCDSGTLTRLVEAWGKALKLKGKARDPKLDDHTLMRVYKIHGDETFKAIRGLGLEPNTKNFDATANCYISRLLKPESFNRLASLGDRRIEDDWLEKLIEEEERAKQNERARI